MIGNIFDPGRISLWLLQLALLAPAILIAVTFHEFAHGYVAYLLGDPTAKERGRLSLNPLRHLDPLGTLMFVIFRFGWGKPVPVDNRYFKEPRWGMAVVSLAGPATNFTMAALLGLLLKTHVVGVTASGSPTSLFGLFVLMTAQINIYLGVLNLLPLPPLDGSRLVSALLPERLLKQYQAIEGYGIAIIFIAIFVFPGGLARIFEPFVGFFQRLFLV